jgi:hypothetical protein
MKAYRTYILPILDYCSPIWSPYKLADIDLLESVQRYFTKRLAGLYDVPYSTRLVRCGLSTLEERRIKTDLALCYQIINGLVALDFASFFKSDTNRRTRGNTQRLLLPKLAHNKTRSNFFSLRTVPIWNSLPDEIILTKPYHAFCSRLDKFDVTKFLKRAHLASC